MNKFHVGNFVKLKNGPVRYSDRVGRILEMNKRNGRTSVTVDFSPRRKTPLTTTVSNLVLY